MRKEQKSSVGENNKQWHETECDNETNVSRLLLALQKKWNSVWGVETLGRQLVLNSLFHWQLWSLNYLYYSSYQCDESFVICNENAGFFFSNRIWKKTFFKGKLGLVFGTTNCEMTLHQQFNGYFSRFSFSSADDSSYEVSAMVKSRSLSKLAPGRWEVLVNMMAWRQVVTSLMVESFKSRSCASVHLHHLQVVFADHVRQILELL